MTARRPDEPKPAATAPFEISRTFAASRRLVWEAWTVGDHLARWFGPKGVTITTAALDLRVGGTLHTCMRQPDGQEMWGKWVFREIAAPERLVFINSFSDAEGGLTRHPFSPTWPLEMLTTVSLTEHDGRTTVTVSWLPINATDEEIRTFDQGRGGMTQGWTGTFEQLADFLAEATSSI